jgi:hypothetical protein
MFDKIDSSGWTYNGRCPKCGKPYIYVGDVPPEGFINGQEPYCTCNENKFYGDLSNTFHFNNQGWTCPKCGKVFSPSIIECIYCNSVSVSWSTTSTATLEKDDNIQNNNTRNEQLGYEGE